VAGAEALAVGAGLRLCLAGLPLGLWGRGWVARGSHPGFGTRLYGAHLAAPKAHAQEAEALVEMDDAGFVQVEPQTQAPQPSGGLREATARFLAAGSGDDKVVGVADDAPRACGELFVHAVEEDVGEQWRERRALRHAHGADLLVPIGPLQRQAEPVLDEREQASVGQHFAQALQQRGPGNTVEAALDVGLGHPDQAAVAGFGQMLDGPRHAAARPVAEAEILKPRVEPRADGQGDGALHHAVGHAGHGQDARRFSRPGDLDAAQRQGLVVAGGHALAQARKCPQHIAMDAAHLACFGASRRAVP